MYTSHGHWFPPAVPGEPLVGELPVEQCAGLNGCPGCMTEANMAAANAVLTSPTPAAPSSPSGSAQPLAVPIDDLKDWYQRYLELKDAESKIKDMLGEARETLLNAIKSKYAELPAKTNMTIGGRAVLQRQVVESNRVDTKRLRAEQPALAARYNVVSQSERLNIL